MRVKSTNYSDRISRRTSIQTLLFFFSQGAIAHSLAAGSNAGVAAHSAAGSQHLSAYPGVLPPAFFAGTAPVQGVTHFDNAVAMTPANLLPATASPHTIMDVGNPGIYPGIGALATGWDFTLTASGGNNVTASFTGSGATGTIPTSSDYCVRCNRQSAGTLQIVGVETDDKSLVHLLSVHLKLNLVPNNPSSLCDITLSGYKLGSAVAGATKTITGMQTQTWTLFDVNANANFSGIDEFRFTATPAGGVVVSSMFVDEITLPITPLPLTLVSFTGRRQDGDVLLSWTTSSEENTRSFEIQRATSGRSYSVVGQVAAAGNSDRTLYYDFTDRAVPLIDPTYFYRLRMIDLDGKSTFSPILSIGASQADFSVSAYPNPCRQQLSLSVTTPAAGQATLVVRDMAGTRLLTSNVSLQKGSNTLPLPAIVRLERGAYLLTVSTPEHQQSVTILKMD